MPENFTDWHKFIDLADELKSRGVNEGEAVRRSSISRAYFGAFQLAASLCVSHGFVRQKNGKDHMAVLKELKGSSDSREREIERNLDKLHGWRIKADYDESCFVDDAAAEFSLICANRVADNFYKRLGISRP